MVRITGQMYVPTHLAQVLSETTMTGSCDQAHSVGELCILILGLTKHYVELGFLEESHAVTVRKFVMALGEAMFKESYASFLDQDGQEVPRAH